MTAARWSLALGAASLVAAALAASGCGAPAQPPKPTPPASTDAAETKLCEGAPPPAKAYHGILRVAKCEDELFVTMAGVARALGVPCGYCHQANAADPTRELYPEPTPKKEIANWMSMHLMQSIKPADGSKLGCSSCHTDENGKPVAKILGEPRDLKKAMEWMNLVMVNKFVTQSGDKLKCKSCHVGNYGTPAWQPKVILHSEQIPPHQAP